MEPSGNSLPVRSQAVVPAAPNCGKYGVPALSAVVFPVLHDRLILDWLADAACRRKHRPKARSSKPQKGLSMRVRLVTAFAASLAVFACETAIAAAPGVTIHPVKGDFDDVRERVVLAVQERGLVLNYTAHIGNMLERTGKDIGRTRQVYVKAELLEFCAAGVSRSAMEADPHNIVFCPYAIAVYTLPAEPGTVYVSYRKPPRAGGTASIAALREAGRLLDGIARDALK
jgi:uncharacterized protein (DUF302 family)